MKQKQKFQTNPVFIHEMNGVYETILHKLFDQASQISENIKSEGVCYAYLDIVSEVGVVDIMPFPSIEKRGSKYYSKDLDTEFEHWQFVEVENKEETAFEKAALQAAKNHAMITSTKPYYLK